MNHIGTAGSTMVLPVVGEHRFQDSVHNAPLRQPMMSQRFTGTGNQQSPTEVPSTLLRDYLNLPKCGLWAPPAKWEWHWRRSRHLLYLAKDAASSGARRIERWKRRLQFRTGESACSSYWIHLSCLYSYHSAATIDCEAGPSTSGSRSIQRCDQRITLFKRI